MTSFHKRKGKYSVVKAKDKPNTYYAEPWNEMKLFHWKNGKVDLQLRVNAKSQQEAEKRFILMFDSGIVKIVDDENYG